MHGKCEGDILQALHVCEDAVPKERLLEYELGSGWDPLCAFLGKEVPDVLFPRANESAIMQEKVDILIVRTAVTALTNLGYYFGFKEQGESFMKLSSCWMNS
jgi:hypothetical protein